MVPLHLITTTVLVTGEQADELVAQDAARWIPGAPGLVMARSLDEREAQRLAARSVYPTSSVTR